MVIFKVTRRREEFKIERYKRLYDRETGKFTIDIRYQVKTEITPRTIGVAEAFGLGVDEYKEHVIYDNVTIKMGTIDILLITGESGSGKSCLLRALEKDLGEEAINIDNIQVNPDKPLIETVGQSLKESLELLSRVGLNDAFLFVRRYSQLSDGQKYRYRIAKLIESGKQYWIMDELCATLDRDMAKIVAFNLQKQARRTHKAVIAATTHMDLFEDLAPSVHIHKGWGKRLEIKYYQNMLNTVCSVTRDLHIEEGTMEDYMQLAEFHYRNPTTHPVLLKIFTLKRSDGTPVGVIMYTYPPINIFGRKETLGRTLSIREANEKIATISRVILHPKYRSIGLGERLVRETMPLVGRPYVEVMAVMAQYNPFFERAGMRRIAERSVDPSILRAVKTLESLGFKSYLLSSTQANLNHLKTLRESELERVREAVLQVSSGYYKRLRSTGETFVKKKEFDEWIHKIPPETLAKVISRLAVLAETKVYLFWENRDENAYFRVHERHSR